MESFTTAGVKKWFTARIAHGVKGAKLYTGGMNKRAAFFDFFTGARETFYSDSVYWLFSANTSGGKF